MILKIWKADESIQYTVDYDVSNGSGTFDGLFSVVNEIYLCEIPPGACDCEGNALDECGVCDGPGSVYECGCSDIDFGECDCDGNILDCSGECGGSAVEDECGVCDGDNSTCADCTGVPNGDAIVDECGVCQGDNSSCTVVLSFGNIIGTSMEILIETPIDIDDFEFTIDNSLIIFSGSSGGFSADYEYSVSIFNQTISGVGGTIPSGSSGILVNLAYQCDYSPIPTGISDNINISSSSGNVIAVFDGVLVNVGALGCTDSTACNYDPLAEEDDGTCVYIQEGECDCDGNVDADFDGICDNEDDCVGVLDPHLIFALDSLYLPVIVDTVAIAQQPNYGGYDVCGICNGNGFSCGFTAEGGHNEITLSWKKPFDTSELVDDVDTTLARMMVGNSTLSSGTYEVYGANGNEISSSRISIYIDKASVNLATGKLDVMVTNIPSCAYCTDPQYDQAITCIGFGAVPALYEAEWIIDTNMTEEDCEDLGPLSGFPSLPSGIWFDGNVSGFQFQLTEIEILGSSGGSAAASSFIVNTAGTVGVESGLSKVIGYSLTGGTIGSGVNQVLTSVTYIPKQMLCTSRSCFGIYVTDVNT
jgi:hypothetical protein